MSIYRTLIPLQRSAVANCQISFNYLGLDLTRLWKYTEWVNTIPPKDVALICVLMMEV